MSAQLMNSSYPAPIGVQQLAAPHIWTDLFDHFYVGVWEGHLCEELCGWGGWAQIPVLGSCREVLLSLLGPWGGHSAHVHSELQACCVSCRQLELLLFQTVL